MKQLNWLQKLKQENKKEAAVPGNIWSSVKNENYNESYPQVEAWLRKISLTSSNQNERKFSSMKNFIMAHKMRLVYTVIILAVIIGACSMPVTTHETVGYMLTWTVPQNDDAAQKINALSWIDKSKLTVNENTNNGETVSLYTLLLPNTTQEQVESYNADLEKIKDIKTVNIFPLNEDVKRPLYSAALYKFFRVNIDATKMNDEELKQEVTRQMKEAGFNNPNVEFKTDEFGRRIFNLKLEHQDNQGKDPQNFELNVNDGNIKEVLKFSTKPLDKEKLKNMTDDQIRQLIKEQHKDLQIDDKDILIERKNGDVTINVKKEDNLGTDFRGGTEVLVRFQQNISIDEIRSALDKSGFIGADIKTAYNGSDILIRTSEQGEGNVISDKITKGLKSSIPNNQFEVLRVNRVGPKVNNMIENQIKVK
jgi:hypothetical protein